MTATSSQPRRRKRRRGKRGSTPPAAPVVTARQPPDASSPGLFDGRYQVRALLGSGTFKKVFLAHDTVTDCDIALGAYRNPTSSERFIARHQAVQALGPHPHIMRVLDAGVGHTPDGAGWVYVTMELLGDASTIPQAVVKHGRPLMVPVVLRLARTVLEGLRHLHDGGLAHGNPGPQNILVDVEGNAKIGDFDWVMPTGTTRIGANDLVEVVGRHQVTPEQLRGQPHDERADLYIAAIGLFVASVGRYPHDTTVSANEWGFSHDYIARLDRLPATPTAINPVLPKQFSDLLLAMLTPDPNYRPQSADEALAELDKIIL